MDTLENHFKEQRDAISARIANGACTEAETNALQAHIATLDGLIKLLSYVTTRRDESATSTVTKIVTFPKTWCRKLSLLVFRGELQHLCGTMG